MSRSERETGLQVATLCDQRGGEDEKERERESETKLAKERNGRGEGSKRDEPGRESVYSVCSSHLTGGREKGYIYTLYYPSPRRGLGIARSARRTHEEGIRTRCISSLSPALLALFLSPFSLNPRFSSFLSLLLFRPFPQLDFAATLPVLFRIAILRYL